MFGLIFEETMTADIFNADETGLFYPMTPDKFLGESSVGGKLSKVRITILVAANMSGTEKRKLLVIGKSANPRYFKNEQLSIKYKSNSKAWMTSEIFTNELMEWDERLRRKNRNIVLLVDNCLAHPAVKLNQIKLIFMPCNTSSKLVQNHSLKSHYRKVLLMRMLEAIDNGKTFSVSLLDAVNFIHMAWQKVNRETIVNCFKHAGFSDKNDEFDSDDELPISQWLEKHEDDPEVISDKMEANVLETAAMREKFNFEEYVKIDDDLVTTETLTDEQIITTVASEMAENGEDENESEDVSVYVPSVSEIVQKMMDIRNFLESRAIPDHVWSSFSNLENYINNIHFSARHVQRKITDFVK